LKEAKNAYYMKNYPDVFAVDGKTMLKKSDGSFVLVSDEEMTALRRENKIGVETVKTLGGKVVDLTQKRILVLKE
jgi:restriction endonuclease Mrr